MGRVRRPGPVRPARVRHAAELAALDRAAPAARPARRRGRAARRRLRRPAVPPRADVGRSSAPAAAAPTSPWATPSARRLPMLLGEAGWQLTDGSRRRAPGVDRGLVPRHPAERRRRPDRQPVRPRRHELHRRRRLRVVARRGRAGRPRAGDRDERHGAGRRGRHGPEPVRLPLLQQDAGALADRALPPVRRRRRRHRDQRGRRRGRAQAAGRRRARRRPDLRRHQGRRRLERRPRPRPDRAAARGPGARAAPRLRAGRRLPGDRRPRRGARHRHGRRRPRRGRGALDGVRRGRRRPGRRSRSARSSR